MSTWTATPARDMLKWYLSLASPTPPASFWLGLSPITADPSVGGFTECTMSNYTRQRVFWTYGGDVYATNNSTLTFGNLDTGTVLGQAIFPSSSSLTRLWWSDLTTALSFGTGHTINYPAGLIRVALNL